MASPLRILFTTQPASGHLRPLIPIAHAAQRRGHTVAVCSAERLRGEADTYGLPFLPTGYDWTAEILPMLPRSYFHSGFAAAAEALAGTEEQVIDLYAGHAARESARGILKIAPDFQPDLIVRELDEFGGYLAAEALGVPHASVASFGGPAVVAGDRLAGQLNAGRAEFGLAADPDGDRLYHYLHANLMPERYSAADMMLPSTRCYRHVSSERPGETLERWVLDLDPHRPTVFVGFGTVVYDLPRAHELVAAVIEAVGRLDCQAVVAVGNGHDPARYQAAPNTRLTTFLAQPLILESADLFVTHGGLNSIKEAARLGVPMVGVPVLEDHKHNMAALTALGIAETVTPAEATVDTLRAAFTKVLEDPSYRRQARAFQREMHVLPTVDTLVDDLEALVRS